MDILSPWVRGPQPTNFKFLTSFVSAETDVIPQLLQIDSNLQNLGSQDAQTFTLPCIVHYDCFSGETALQLWCLDPCNYSIFENGAGIPQIVGGFCGKENRLRVYCTPIFTSILKAFRKLFKLPEAPQVKFRFLLQWVVGPQLTKNSMQQTVETFSVVV